MVKVAITGNIAAGKSEVEKILISKGYKVFDTDQFTHQILATSDEIKEAFKKYDILDNNEISRKKLGALIFNNPDLKIKLEKLIHPQIRTIIENIKSDDTVFISVPLLYEAGMEELFDYTIFVSADETIRLDRLMARNHLSKEEALIRLNSQQKETEKIQKSDFIIINNGSIQELEKELNKILSALPINS